MREQPPSDTDEEGDEVVRSGSCFAEYHFALVGNGCDVYYLPLGRGVAIDREYAGELKEGSSQAVPLRKAHQTPMVSSVKALIVGFDLGEGITVPNITKFGSSMGKFSGHNITSLL